MFKPNRYIKHLKHQDIICKNNFKVLCWNVAKLTLNKSYIEYIKSIIEKEQIDILLLQEVKKQLAEELSICDFSYILSPNIQTKKHIYGVLSAFKVSCQDELSLLTRNRELSYATHKASLITRHKISKHDTLLMVNLHAINFVKNSDFYYELQQIKSSVKSHKGAMIVAGDFNTWNTKRVGMLKEFSSELSLKEVKFDDNSNIKKFFTNSLDYIFYRDLELIDSKVIDSKKISDHNPIIASFRLQH
ncbi:endonuclease/exonuclease/phosphatase family protein [Sulfurimonas sp.]|uniref:endonuclease/exonuclease/phosphatase family protein n=1 Tax=Sulfurimonas sp. TaxID=2022749 RepID=UPI0035685BF6